MEQFVKFFSRNRKKKNKGKKGSGKDGAEEKKIAKIEKPDLIEEKNLIYEIIKDDPETTGTWDFTKTKIVHSIEHHERNSLLKKKKIFERKPMTKKDWIIFLNNCFLKQTMVRVKDKNTTYLLRSFILDGIPIELRSFAYVILSGAFLHLEQTKGSKLSDQYAKIDYFAEIEKASDLTVDQIQKDLDRVHLPYEFTILKHPDKYKEKHVLASQRIDIGIKTQAMNILKAYSVVDEEVGYVQGMASIAVCLVFNFFVSKWVFERSKLPKKIKLRLNFDEEEVFWVFYGIIHHMRSREYFKVGFKPMVKRVGKFEQILKDRIPKVLEKLTENDVKIQY